MNIELKPMSIHILTENIFGIYKNISRLSKIKKTIALTIISIEISMCLYVIYTELNNFKYAYFTCVIQLYSIISILLSCYYSKAYMKFLNCLNSNDILVDFLNDNIYSKRLASHFKIGLLRLWSYIFFYFLMVITSKIFDVNIALRRGEDVMIIFGRALSVLRLHVELNFICYIFHSISEQLQCITRSVVERTSYYCEETDAIQEINLKKWLQNYINIKKCTVIFNKILGIQVYLQFVFFLHKKTLFNVLNITDDKKLKVVKELLRIVTTRPIEVKAFGGIVVNMTLIPACLTVVGCYTVVALQFNNVV
ncbi:uncharacterized protein LOC133525299 [Cydia pomonella]|uniref:uncharacterized protein LOC133525299 n=1 Tax=Cydia pomonella TaxID=82600 RepID=UPI002ADDDC7E|nr:uncharacterized protein LOC133525299 [Cydia pomonella]